jgi:hypothetical protein
MQELFSEESIPLGSGERHDDLGIVAGHEGDAYAALERFFEENRRTGGAKAGRGLVAFIGTVTVLPGLYLLSKMVTVPSGSIGTAIDNGIVRVYGPGRHCLMSLENTKADFVTFELTREVCCFSCCCVRWWRYRDGWADCAGDR